MAIREKSFHSAIQFKCRLYFKASLTMSHPSEFLTEDVLELDGC